MIAELLALTLQASCQIELVVLGVGQDGGAPQLGRNDDPAWEDPSLAMRTVSLGVVHHETGERFLFEATPDMREQLHDLDAVAGTTGPRAPDGIFLTHAHIGHYTGLMFLGHESMGAEGARVYALERMSEFLRTNGPWSQLVEYGNIDLVTIPEEDAFGIAPRLIVQAFTVPHRQEFSEVAGYRIMGLQRSVLFIPDIDSWEEYDPEGGQIEQMIASVDRAYFDATFFDDGEIPGRDMSGFPHPFIRHSMARFAHLPDDERAKIRFIHFNHTNPVRFPDSPERAIVEAAGYGLAERGERFCLSGPSLRHPE